MRFVYNRTKRIVKAGIALLIMGSVAGCGASSAENTVVVTENSTLNTVLQSPKGNAEYERKMQVPGILVDQVG